ncbi:hypothetical protein GE09DRAFT_1214154 [Coniochaeta sp. 2T2.1]|nr:hypothetical protein GE09DRAFT_1214154 [Coniochaeta sp. 2T2.1]
MSDALIPQTTPFVHPSVCADLFTTTTFTATPYGNKQQQAKVHALVPDQADSRFSSCYPGGPGRSDQYSFSPALTAVPATPSVSGYVAVDTTTSTAQADITPLATLDRNDDYRIQQPWHIAWMPSDTSSLSPAPPEWTCTSELLSWVLGNAVSKDCPDGSPHDDDYLAGLGTFYGLVIGLPIGISRKKAQSLSRTTDVPPTAYGGDPTSQTMAVPAPAYRRSSETTDVPPAYTAKACAVSIM